MTLEAITYNKVLLLGCSLSNFWFLVFANPSGWRDCYLVDPKRTLGVIPLVPAFLLLPFPVSHTCRFCPYKHFVLYDIITLLLHPLMSPFVQLLRYQTSASSRNRNSFLCRCPSRHLHPDDGNATTVWNLRPKYGEILSCGLKPLNNSQRGIHRVVIAYMEEWLNQGMWCLNYFSLRRRWLYCHLERTGLVLTIYFKVLFSLSFGYSEC